MSSSSHIMTTANLQRWTAWAPGLPDRASWEQWLRHDTLHWAHQDAPACAHIPPLLRRRCSYLARMVLEVAFRVCEETQTPPHQVHTIYCSRHGEMQTLRTLFDDLAKASPLSPTFFGNAVHHTPTGYWSIAAQNPLISRTMSGGEQSFAYGYLEAWCSLRRFPERPVLLVHADQILPEPFAIRPALATILVCRRVAPACGVERKGASHCNLGGLLQVPPQHRVLQRART